MSSSQSFSKGNPGRFQSTRWSLILAAQGSSPQAKDALSSLCEAYWYPLYAFVRRQGHNASDAADMTQGFFLGLLDRRDLHNVDPQRGRFRSYLLAAMKHFLINEHRRANAQKRGGGQRVLSFDFDAAEGRYRGEPPDRETPESLFARQWALTLLERVNTELRREYADEGKTALYQHLQGKLGGGEDLEGYRELGERLGMSEGAVKAAMHRMRRRFRQILREEIAQTVAAPEEIDGEVAELFEVLRR